MHSLNLLTAAMSPFPLFTKHELTQAFELVLPEAVATSTADEWWKKLADRVDSEGHYLSDDRFNGKAPAPSALGVAAAGKLSPAEAAERERAFWGNMSVPERKELLLRFSTFHLGLVALVSPALRERMRAALGWEPEQMDRNQDQMRRIVSAMKGSRT